MKLEIHFIKIWLFLSFLGQYVFAFQQPQTTPYISKISFQEGLKTQVIYDLFIDDKGLLYLGTDQGLMSYNGTFFKPYGFKNSLSPAIDQLQLDGQGKLWCKNFSDQIFYFEKDTLIAHQNVNQFLAKKQENLVDFFAGDKLLYFITEKHLYAEKQNGKIVEIIAFKNDNLFFKLHFDKSSERLFVLSNYTINEIKDTILFKSYQTIEGQKDMALIDGKIFYFLKGNKNKLYTLKNEITIPEKSQQNQYFYNLIKTDEELWLCTSDGVKELNPVTEKIENNILTGVRVNDITKDFEGNYWISSVDNGLFFMPNKQMMVFKPKNQKLSQNYLTIQADEKGNIYVGTTKGEILKLDNNLNLKHVYKAEITIEISYIYPYKDYLISSSGIFRNEDNQAITKNYLGKDISLDNLGNFIIANYNSASLIPTQLDNAVNIPEGFKQWAEYDEKLLNDNSFTLRSKRSRAVHFSQKNKGYYVGFSDGFFKFNLDGSIEEIKTEREEKIIARDIDEDTQGNLWVATTQQGLLMLNKNNKVQIFNAQSGLSGDYCKKVQVDNNGVWVLTEEGLDYLNANNKILNVGSNFGLKNAGINSFLVFNDKIWLATKDGLIYFSKNGLSKAPDPFLDIAISHKNGEFVKNKDAIPYQKNNLIVDLNAILYKNAGDYSFEYILQPYQKQWQSQDARQNQLNFLSLSPNKYTLKVRINAGSFVSKEKVISFEVLKPFWAEQWFILSSFLMLCLLMFGVYKWAVKRAQKVQTVKEKLAISQLTAIRSQMNPHFMFNILNAIQGLIYSNQKSEANSFIGTFSSLMRKTLDISARREISIEDELETIELYISLEKARFDNEEFQYNIILPEIDLSKYTIPSLIIQPFVENAIKHGLMHKRGLKRLIIQLKKYDNTYWEFSIEDNGIGRKKSMEINKKIKNKHQSFAMNAIYERINLINKLNKLPLKIEIEDLMSEIKQPLGTKVTLYIPINHENTDS